MKQEMATDRETQIAKLDAARFLEFSGACAVCQIEAQFADIVRSHVRPLLPHALLAAVVGRIDLEHLQMLHFVGVDYPTAALAALPSSLNLRERPVVKQWLAERDPLVLALPRDAHRLSERERFEIESFGLGHLAIHGSVDISSRSGVYLSFGQVSESVSDEAAKRVLRLMAPALSQALLAVYANERADAIEPANALTTLEKELLKCVTAGRSNGEIAQMRGRSVATVRNQLHATLKKLGISNRTEAARFVLRQDGAWWRG